MSSRKLLAASARSSGDQLATASSGLLSLRIISLYPGFHLHPSPEPWASFLPEGKALQPVYMPRPSDWTAGYACQQ